MDSDSDADFEVVVVALFLFQGSRRSRLHRKKENIGYKQGYFRTSDKASSSSMLHLFAFPIAVVSRTSVCNSDKIPQEIRRASDAALA